MSESQSTCTFNGITFGAGDILGDAFQTRCGSSDDFPCFCDPDRDPPIDCPYCGIPTTMNDQGLICARVGGPFIQVINLDGDAEECSCNRDISGNPQSTCLPAGTSNGGNNPAPSPSSQVCRLEWADGSVDIFRDGESYGDLFKTGCGAASEYPCFCNVSIPSKLYCPYCTLPTSSGGLICAGIGERFSVAGKMCRCDGNLNTKCSTPTPAPIPRPTKVPLPTTRPPTPTIKPTLPTTAAPVTAVIPTPLTSMMPSEDLFLFNSSSPSIEVSSEPTMVPSTRFPTIASPSLDKPSVWVPSRTPPEEIPVPGCLVTDEEGKEVLLTEGEILPDMEGPCSPLSTYPAICNPNMPGRVEFPYCVFSSVDRTWESSTGQTSDSDPFLVCARNGEQVSVPTASDGELVTCSCLYLNPYIGVVSSCPDFLVSVRLVWTTSPTTSPFNDDSPSRRPSTDVDGNPTTTSSGTIQQFVTSWPSTLGVVLVSVVLVATAFHV